MTIAFDIDGCLVDKKGEPIKANIAIIQLLSEEHKILLWSGNGWQYAYDIANKLDITPFISGVLNKYNTITPDICFDDQEINLGKVNITV